MIVLEEYLYEVFEAFVCIMLVIMMMRFSKKNFYLDIQMIIKFSLIIGFITWILEYYSKDFKESVKSGIRFTTGASLIKFL